MLLIKASYQEVMPYYFVNRNKIKHYLLMAENDQLLVIKYFDLDKALRQRAIIVI
jgi:hypothetical protein